MSWRVLTDVPYGNACDISIGTEGDVSIISFASDPHGGPESLWFCLRLEKLTSEEETESVRLILKYPENMLGASDPRKIRPVIRSQPTGNWRRMEAGIPEETRDGRLQVVWTLERPDDSIDIAFCYPYGLPELESLVTDTDGYWKLDRVGVSQGARPLVRLSNYGDSQEPRDGVFVIARQHSGETPGSWVLDGFLRRIATMGSEAPFVWAIPLANMDGVEEGHYGKDGYPYDLNRAWGNPPMRHEALVYRRDMERWFSRCRPAIALDFHAPGCCESSGIYAFLPSPEKYPEAHAESSRLAMRIGDELDTYAAEDFARVASYASRWDTPGFTSHCCSKGLISMALETPYSQIGDVVLTRRHYREAGSRIAEAAVDFLNGETE